MSVPPDFDRRPLSIVYVRPEELCRLFRKPATGHLDPIYFGRSAVNRFDAPSTIPSDQRFGVAYAAFDTATCFAETVTREDNQRLLQYGGIAVSESTQVAPRFVANLSGSTMLRVADVTDVSLYLMGAEAGIFNSPIYPSTTQPWSAAIYNRPEEVDGLMYRSRFLNGRFAIAIYERGSRRIGLTAAKITPLQRHADYPSILSQLRVCLLP